MSARRVTRARSNLSLTQQMLSGPSSQAQTGRIMQSQVNLNGSARTTGIERVPGSRRPPRTGGTIGTGRLQVPGWVWNWRRRNSYQNPQRANPGGPAVGTGIRLHPGSAVYEHLAPSAMASIPEHLAPSATAAIPNDAIAQELMELSSGPSGTEDSLLPEDAPEVQILAPTDFTNLVAWARDPPSVSALPIPDMAGTASLLSAAIPSMEVGSSQDDFRPMTGLLSKASVASKRKEKLDDTIDESELCTICYEQWTTSGRHRLVCLKCGHLYGQECIEKWLDTQDKGTCPQCNAKASRKDIRCLYIRKLAAVDNTELERAKRELEEEKVARKKAEMDLGLMKLRWQQSEDRCSLLRRELAEQRELNHTTAKQIELATYNQVPSGSGRYHFEKSFTFDVGGCRALAYNAAKMYLCASQASPSALYPGFGVRKVSTADLRTTQYIPLHSRQIRDLGFHPVHERALLLSCSMDKTVKITSMDSLETVQSFTCSSPAWSCTWDSENPNQFFVGSQSGEVLLYDIRDTRDHVATLIPQMPESKSVVSLRHVPRSISDSPGPGGLLVGQLDRSLFLEHHEGLNYFTHYLSNDSVLMSLHREEATGHILASYRPTQQMPSVRHEVNNLVLTPKPPAVDPCPGAFSFYERVSYVRVRSFTGGNSQQTLTRTALLTHPDEGPRQLFVCAGDGSSNKLYLWNVSTGSLQQQLIGPDQGVLDVCPVNHQGAPVILSAVGNKQLFLYKWKE